MTDAKALVVFQPSGRRGRVPLGLELLEAARQLGVGLEAPCGGNQACGKCLVRIETGRHDRYGIDCRVENASPAGEGETALLTPRQLEEGYRLACSTKVQGDLVVFLPESSRAAAQVVSKDARELNIQLKPAVRFIDIELNKPSLEDPTADLERLLAALEGQGLSGLRPDPFMLRDLGVTLRKGDWRAQAVVYQDTELITVRPAGSEPALGMAIDVGTTTMAAYLCDLATGDLVETASMMNPQVTYGEDVVSRISYQMHNEGGLEKLQSTLVEGLNGLVQKALAAASAKLEKELTPGDILDMAICGNTVMQHTLLGLDPEPLGGIPFTPAHHQGINIKARELGIQVNPGAYIYVLPNIAAYVGGDHVGVILAEEPQKHDEMQLIIDVGTNGELVLGNKERLICTSCATGPALEGAHIAFGMRAAPGAIERVKVDPDTLEVDYKVVGRETWRSFSEPKDMQVRGICGSGILDAVAELFRTGVVLKSGAFNPEQPSRRYRVNPETNLKEFVLAWADESSLGRDVVIDQKDVREIQMAKAAIYSGCKLMLQRLGIKHPDRIKIAGAFGLHIDRTLALVMGLFPDCPLDRVETVGNAAGDGCRAALLNLDKRSEAEQVARKVQYLELSLEPVFQNELVEATQFPHMNDEFPSLAG